MASYPAAKRSGQTEALMYAERERLYDRQLDRKQMNALMERLQAKLGSKNKLAEAVYGRKNAASAVKQVMEGTVRYTDAVIDRILQVAEAHGVARHEAVETVDAAPANDADIGTVADVDSGVLKESPMQTQDIPIAPEDAEHPKPTIDAPAEDWLSGVRDRRAAILGEVTAGEERIVRLREEMARLQSAVDEIEARNDASRRAIGEIDGALSILQAI